MQIKLGVVILAHKNLSRAHQVASYFVKENCRVQMHVDQSTELPPELQDAPYQVSQLHRSEWGGFGLVAATIDATKALLTSDASITHVALLSESCLPIRPVRELLRHLNANPDTDFITTRSLDRNDWIRDGLIQERITLYHPFSFRKQRRLFEANIALQRRLGISRRLPDGLIPFTGDQWWCLRRHTLEHIFAHPSFDAVVGFMKSSWIPDELFFQTMVQAVPNTKTSDSLTFVEFDRQGKPYSFYDNHISYLEALPDFFARKIWHGSSKLYDHFLADRVTTPKTQQSLLRDSVPHRTRSLVNMGLAQDVRARSYRITNRKFVVFVGFQTADPKFKEHITEFDLSLYFDFFARARRAKRAHNGPGNTVLSAKHLIHNPHALLANVLASDVHEHVALCFEPGDHHGLWSTLLRTQSAQIVFLEDHWRARATANMSDLYRRRAERAYNKLLDPELKKQMRADFHRVSWDAYHRAPLATLSGLGFLKPKNAVSKNA